MAAPASAIPSTSSQHAPSPIPHASGSQTNPPGAVTVPAVQWDRCLLTFFRNAGLTECCKAFELDMLVMSPEQERIRVPAAIGQLVRDFTTPINPHNAVFRDLEDRKPDYLATTKEPVSHSSHVATVSRFLAQSRARNDQSNRSEFLRADSIIIPPRPPDDGVDKTRNGALPIGPSSAARTAARPIDRDVQMQYDIVKNSEGPLRRTTGKGKQNELQNVAGQGKGGRQDKIGADVSTSTLSDHPGLEERFAGIEDHLAVRYVPAPPEDLFYRVKALEDHLVKLEKDYPPWSALHFNQPQRVWPPAPRTTPIIIPTHLTALADDQPLSKDAASTEAVAAIQEKPKKAKASRTESSLRRAVMEKLEVQKALNELKGISPDKGSDSAS
ncbi:hypothetical protein CALCODRAFT_380503 [Calocera cornea HHB12733]|uniref:Uncharacterized protein n=1 Tax=Calocera cornea HHB12733 TaxID=1353952 RepID=A0A165ECT5_9BASI|nr:hypothetical protein CALCODRAFT_380503 [Calocera cornea HHB12733]